MLFNVFMMIFQNVLFFYKIELDVFNSYSGFDPIVPTKNFSISRSLIHTVPCKPKRRPIILMSHPNIHPNSSNALTTANRPFIAAIKPVYPDLSCLFEIPYQYSMINLTVWG